MQTLDQFLENMEQVQVCLESFTGTAEMLAATGPNAINERINERMRRQGVVSGGARSTQSGMIPTINARHEKMSTMGGITDENASVQQLTNDPSARSVFQVAYSQKSEMPGNAKTKQGNNPLQVSVAQTMNQLQQQKM